jgi:hypothetical protein
MEAICDSRLAATPEGQTPARKRGTPQQRKAHRGKRSLSPANGLCGSIGKARKEAAESHAGPAPCCHA